jgi:hypothetical protein
MAWISADQHVDGSELVSEVMARLDRQDQLIAELRQTVEGRQAEFDQLAAFVAGFGALCAGASLAAERLTAAR